MNPIISIIITCFNSSEYLGRCMESVLRSASSFNVEIILIDDGSTDDTFAIMQDYQRRDARIAIFHKPNGGYCSGINYGLERSRGEYVMMLGSDDELTDELVGVLFEQIGRCQPDILVFRSVLFLEKTCSFEKDERTYFEDPLEVSGSIFSLDIDFQKWTRVLFKRDTSKLFKASVLRGHHYLGKYGVYCDDVFSACVSLSAAHFLFVPYVGYVIHVREASLSNAKITKDRLLDQLHVLSAFLRKCAFFERKMVDQASRSPSFIRLANAWCANAINAMKRFPSDNALFDSVLELWRSMKKGLCSRVYWKYRVILSIPRLFVPLLNTHDSGT